MATFKADFKDSDEVLDMDTRFKWDAERMAYHYAQWKGLHLKTVWAVLPQPSEETPA